MNWVEEVVNQHREFESPLSFWKWAALTSISAVVKDNVWLDKYLYKCYPNIYVMFHAESGLKKGPPVSLAARLVKEVNNTKVIKGRSSIQAILKEMGSNSSYTVPGGKIVSSKSTAFICSSELSSSIVGDPIATTILTDLYDRNYNVGEWRSLLKMETFDLKSPTITMLTATNESHADSFFERKDITGGYYARTFIIHETEENKSNSLMVPPELVPDVKQMSLYLKELAKLSGPFESLGSRVETDKHLYPYRGMHYTEAGILYEQWYENFKEVTRTVQDKTGTLNRFGDSVLKVAMLLALGRAPVLFIDAESMQEAIDTCEKLLGNIRKITVGKTGGEDATNAVRKSILIQELMARDNHMISKQQLLKKYWIQGNVKEWEECMVSFQEAGLVTLEANGPHMYIKMTDISYEEMKRFLQGKVSR